MYDGVNTISLASEIECSDAACNLPSYSLSLDQSYGTIAQISSTDLLLESQAYSDLGLIPSNPFPLVLSVTTSGITNTETLSMGSFDVQIIDPCDGMTLIDSITGLSDVSVVEG